MVDGKKNSFTWQSNKMSTKNKADPMNIELRGGGETSDYVQNSAASSSKGKFAFAGCKFFSVFLSMLLS